MNIKSLNIDCDNATTVVNGVEINIGFTRGNEYILQANCYANASSTSAVAFDAGDIWGLYIGRQYQSNANPVVVITDPGKFNQNADWSEVDPTNGLICARVNVGGSVLTTDMGNASSQTYTLQWVNVNNTGASVMVCDTSCIITNAVQK